MLLELCISSGGIGLHKRAGLGLEYDPGETGRYIQFGTNAPATLTVALFTAHLGPFYTTK